MSTVSEIGEHGLIRLLRNRVPMRLAGDDAAVLDSLVKPVITTDSFFQGTHFHTWWTQPGRLGTRLLEATLSDLAAMGAAPGYLFAAVTLPPDMDLDWLVDFYRGLSCRHDCSLAGGETVKGGVFGVTLTAVGELGDKEPLLRSNAEPGDSLWVTGPMGRSLDAPEILDKSQTTEPTPQEQQQIELFLEPKARFDSVDDIRKAGGRTAIDISDGLVAECGHISRESGVEVQLDLDSVPLVEYARGRPLEGCTAGEDFELLFTLPAGRVPSGRYYRIGRILSGEGVAITQNGKKLETAMDGYDHFLA